MSQVALDLLMTLLFISASGLMTLAEMAVISARKSKLQDLSDKGHKGAAIALELIQSPGEFLANVQTAITINGLASGAFSGITLGEKLSETITFVFPNVSDKIAHLVGVGTIVILVGFLTITAGELLPKRLALINPESMACLFARPLQLLGLMNKPITRILNLTTNKMLKVLGFDRQSQAAPVSEDEMRILIDEASDAGVFDKGEGLIMKRAMRLSEIKIGEIMTPRTQVVMINLDAPHDSSLETIIGENFSHYPTYRGEMDHPQGFISAKKLLSAMTKNDGKILSVEQGLVENPLFLPEAMDALEALQRFKATTNQIAMVIDEHGGLAGIISIIDVLEAIVGEMPNDTPLETPSVFKRADGSLLVDGITLLDNLEEMTGLREFIEREEQSIQTLGGLVMHELGRIPRHGDLVNWKGLTFEVVDMDGNRVDKVLITVNRPPEDDG